MATYTARQHEVLAFIRSTLEERGIAPTLEEIGTDLGGISRVAVLDHLRALEKKGAIRRKARASRAIEVLDPTYAPARGIPLAGSIAAGSPILELEDREDVSLDEFLGVVDGSFLLRVRGNSMIDDHICDGDLVLIESARTARDGETVVAVVSNAAAAAEGLAHGAEDEVTLKRLYRDGDRVRLQPANTELDAMYYPRAAVQIRGIVRGVIRRT